jgi:hypothetical protein
MDTGGAVRASPERNECSRIRFQRCRIEFERVRIHFERCRIDSRAPGAFFPFPNAFPGNPGLRIAIRTVFEETRRLGNVPRRSGKHPGPSSWEFRPPGADEARRERNTAVRERSISRRERCERIGERLKSAGVPSKIAVGWIGAILSASYQAGAPSRAEPSPSPEVALAREGAGVSPGAAEAYLSSPGRISIGPPSEQSCLSSTFLPDKRPAPRLLATLIRRRDLQEGGQAQPGQKDSSPGRACPGPPDKGAAKAGATGCLYVRRPPR